MPGKARGRGKGRGTARGRVRAGSKGKGSTAVMTASVLTAAGYKTGLYTSPHLHLFNERIRVDDKLISNDEIVELVAKIKPEVEAVNEEALYGRWGGDWMPPTL